MKYLFINFFLLNFIAIHAQNSVTEKQLEAIDFRKINAEIAINPYAQKVEGKVDYKMDFLQAVDSFYLDAQNMEFKDITFNGKSIKTNDSENKLWIKKRISPSENNELSLRFSAKPSQTMYFINWDFPESIDSSMQVWTQGQGKKTSHWLPVIDNQNEKVEFDLSIDFKSGYEVISNGKLMTTEKINDSISRWKFDMENPMSSYLLAVAVGKFEKEKIESDSGIPISLFMEERDSVFQEPTYRHTREIFDFLEEEIGVAYPWGNYKQVPVQDFLHAGMENTGATIFARALLTDENGFKDRNYVNVNAHELAHQWFGNLVTQQSEKDHWLHEGFATYYALLAEKEIFGEDYYFWKLYEWAEQLKELSDRGKGEALMKEGGSSLTYYQKGAWALHILREQIGYEVFKTAVSNYLETYAYKNATIENFIAEAELASDQDLSGFMADWLNQTAFQGTEALNSLKQSEFVLNYLEIAALREIPLSQKAEVLDRALEYPVNDYTGQEIVFQLAGETSADAMRLYKKAFESRNHFVRQAIALSMDEIPRELKSDYELLLNDESWLTIEAALTNLWMQFPDENTKYLEKTQGLQGFSNKNLRILWLTLNLATPAFDAQNQQKNYAELTNYTAAYQPFEVRETAFGYLYQINAFNEQNLRDLVQGTQHHTYAFRNYCRELLAELLKNPDYRQKFENLKNQFSGKEKAYLEDKLGNA